MVGGRDAGSIGIERRPAETYLGRIEIHPDYQGQGISSRLIQDLLEEREPRASRRAITAVASNFVRAPAIL